MALNLLDSYDRARYRNLELLALGDWIERDAVGDWLVELVASEVTPVWANSVLQALVERDKRPSRELLRAWSLLADFYFGQHPIWFGGNALESVLPLLELSLEVADANGARHWYLTPEKLARVFNFTSNNSVLLASLPTHLNAVAVNDYRRWDAPLRFDVTRGRHGIVTITSQMPERYRNRVTHITRAHSNVYRFNRLHQWIGEAVKRYCWMTRQRTLEQLHNKKFLAELGLAEKFDEEATTRGQPRLGEVPFDNMTDEQVELSFSILYQINALEHMIRLV